ncbi:hypothetical protein D3C86_1638400 [compost metagenome]
MQWGRITGVDGSNVVVNLPTAFTTTGYAISYAELTGPTPNPITFSSLTTSTFTADSVGASQVYSYIVIGF